MKALSGLRILGIIAFFTMFNACATNQSRVSETKTLKELNPPEWVLKGGGAYNDSKGKAFYGVGTATGIKNYSLQRTAADDRARNDVAKTIDLYTKSLNKDYQAHVTAGDFKSSSEEQKVEVAVKTVTSAVLSGVMIIDHWESPGREELFSLARLDFESFKQQLEAHKELSESVRKLVSERAEKLHEEMEIEVLKKEGKSR